MQLRVGRREIGEGRATYGVDLPIGHSTGTVLGQDTVIVGTSHADNPTHLVSWVNDNAAVDISWTRTRVQGRGEIQTRNAVRRAI